MWLISCCDDNRFLFCMQLIIYKKLYLSCLSLTSVHSLKICDDGDHVFIIFNCDFTVILLITLFGINSRIIYFYLRPHLLKCQCLMLWIAWLKFNFDVPLCSIASHYGIITIIHSYYLWHITFIHIFFTTIIHSN